MQSTTSNSRAVRAKEAAAFLGIGKSTFWRWVKEGRIPKGISLSSRATVWRVEELEHFLNRCAAGKEGRA